MSAGEHLNLYPDAVEIREYADRMECGRFDARFYLIRQRMESALAGTVPVTEAEKILVTILQVALRERML